MSTPVTIGTSGSDTGTVDAASAPKLKFVRQPVSLQGDQYSVKGNPPRIGPLAPKARVPKYMVSGVPLILDGDDTGTGGTLAPELRFLKFNFQRF